MRELVDAVKEIGFPSAIVVWMFWRDYRFSLLISEKLATIITLLGALAANMEDN